MGHLLGFFGHFLLILCLLWPIVGALGLFEEVWGRSGEEGWGIVENCRKAHA